MRYVICIEYDGYAFHGWQSQPGGQTVQDCLERAYSSIAGEAIVVHAAGRTDTGVHAMAQVAHFDSKAIRKPQAWVRGVNALLPRQIAVRWAMETAPDFHARFAAIGRRYRYVLFNHPVRPGLQTGRVGWFHRHLDETRMQAAAGYLLGTQDFSSFRSSDCQAKSPVKSMTVAQIGRHGNMICFDFEAGGFLHHMVRNIVGALIWVGAGKTEPEWMLDLLAAKDRRLAPPTFMPDGLYFAGVAYEAKWNLPNGGRIMGDPNLLDMSPCREPV